jgi:cytidyltransferase-like protein
MKNLDPKWVARLGQSGRDCYDAIVKMDARALGASLNLNMQCWETLLPHVVRHPLLRVDLMPLLEAYQRQYLGAMYSGCGGGYLIVVSNEPVPGALQTDVRISQSEFELESEMSPQKQVIVSGGFDDIKSRDLRFLEEAAKLGDLTVLLWTDNMIQQRTGRAPKFPLAERSYFLNAVRYVGRVMQLDHQESLDSLPRIAGLRPEIWADVETMANPAREEFAGENGITYRVFTSGELKGFPEPPPMPSAPGRKKIVATGCYDWFHSGHVRFTEEASAYGDLYVCLGSDANVRLLKGNGHPLLTQEERRYVIGSIKFVKQALVNTGSGWLDADPEIRRLKPDIYVVNEDGDKGGKREYCQKLGIEYLVLKRIPAPGLPARSGTVLRGF